MTIEEQLANKRKLLEDEYFEHTETELDEKWPEHWWRTDVNVFLQEDGSHFITLDWLPD
jgi:hypothetical protein